MEFDTKAIHSGLSGSQWSGASSVPIFQSTSYEYKTAQELADVFAGKAPGHIYTRISNPTNFALERRITELEDGIGCIVTSSGMAAISSVVLALAKAGDEIITTNGIFGGTVSLFARTLSRLGIKAIFVDPLDTESFERAVSSKTKLIFVESICNPSLCIPDFEGISKIAKQANIPFVVDSTLTTPCLFKAVDFGADIVVHSTSKFINGHGSAIGGAIIDTGNFNWRENNFDEIKQLTKKVGQMAFLAYLRNSICRDLGGCAAPFNSFLMLQGLETLGARMSKHCDNASRLAEILVENEKVSWVKYPGLTGSDSCDKVNRYFNRQAGSLLIFGLGSRENCFKFIDSLRVCRNLANLGDAKTLVIHPASTIFCEFSEEERLELDISDDMIRVSVGIEGFEDIRSDFENAIEKVFGR